MVWFGRHGLKPALIERPESADAGQTLLSLAINQKASLIVMGAYGHSRFRELMLGGVTRTMLQSMTAPVLMSH